MRAPLHAAVALVVLVVLVVLVAALLSPRPPRPPCPPRQDMTLKTGDLLLFKSRCWDVVVAVRTSFTHVGLVCIVDDTSFVVETHGDDDIPGQRGGVHMYKAAERIRGYDGTVAHLPLRHPLTREQTCRLLARAAELQAVPYDANHKTHFLKNCLPRCVPGFSWFSWFSSWFVWGEHYPEKPGRSAMFCSEFVAVLLQSAGVLPREADAACMAPDDFIGMRQFAEPSEMNIAKSIS